MKKIIFKIIIFLVIGFALFHLFFGVILPKMVMATNDSNLLRWKRFYEEETNAEALVIGSSRAHRGYNTNILTEETGIKFHNISCQGMALQNYSRILSDYLKNNKVPKKIIINIDLFGLAYRDRIADLQYLLPSIRENSELYQNIYQFRYIKYYRPYGYFFYKDEFYKILEFPSHKKYDGFQPLDLEWKTAPTYGVIMPSQKFRINKEKSTREIEQILKIIEEKQIREVIFSLAPLHYSYWQSVDNQEEIMDFILKITKENNIKLLNFNNLEMSKQSKYYYDAVHFNIKGAKVFSEILADSIK